MQGDKDTDFIPEEESLEIIGEQIPRNQKQPSSPKEVDLSDDLMAASHAKKVF